MWVFCGLGCTVSNPMDGLKCRCVPSRARQRAAPHHPACRRRGFCSWELRRGIGVSSHLSSQQEGIPETVLRTPRCSWATTFHHSRFGPLVLRIQKYSIFITLSIIMSVLGGGSASGKGMAEVKFTTNLKYPGYPCATVIVPGELDFKKIQEVFFFNGLF